LGSFPRYGRVHVGFIVLQSHKRPHLTWLDKAFDKTMNGLFVDFDEEANKGNVAHLELSGTKECSLKTRSRKEHSVNFLPLFC
jgi:hypothetical protein